MADTPSNKPGPTSQAETVAHGPSSPARSRSQAFSQPASYVAGERLAPGALIAGRYRIVALLGKGGMGEVYRAEDMTLGQEVALKFLPGAFAGDPNFLERFHNEVRIARQVSHPHVCRVYDIFQGDGQLFLSMEYVDGEDLGSLLKRIGRLPGDKALEFSRKICAGLAAAHDKGVLHRDLKPGNILIDGRGQPLLTDFGLAAMAGDIEDIRSGTPQYQAPEQRAGREVTAKSDIYSLGVVLYEMFTGRQAFSGGSMAELDAQQAGGDVPSMASIARDVDPAVEAVIERCLDPNPSRRPTSALAVSAALPGGDPLAAALAAGETPSPELVAASGAKGGISTRLAVASVAVTVLGLAASVYLGSLGSLTSRVPMDVPVDVLDAKAREIAAAVGYTATPAARARGFYTSADAIEFLNNSFPMAERDRILSSGAPTAIQFWYRQSPRPLDPNRLGGGVTAVDPQNTTISGMVTLALDPRGNLVTLIAVPPQIEDAKDEGKPADWGIVLRAAGLDPAKLQAADPIRVERVAFDARVAWTGTLPGSPKVPMRFEGASWRGRPVYFSQFGPWDKPTRMIASQVTPTQLFLQWFWVAVFLIVLVASSLLAYRNWRLGRGDLRGAIRLADTVVVLTFLAWLFGGAHVASVNSFNHLVAALGNGMFYGGALCLAYVALEPFVRRRWPHTLISWTRLLSGKVRDPIVAGHALAGVALGVVWSLVFEAQTLIAQQFHGTPRMTRVDLLSGFRALPAWVFSLCIDALAIGLGSLFLLFLARVLLRHDLLSRIAFILMTTAIAALASPTPWLEGAFSLAQYSIFVFVMLRLGLLTAVLGILVSSLLPDSAMTMDWAAWNATPTIFATIVVLSLSLVLFRWATRGRSLFGDFLDT
ncbi:MAG: protein kinase [Bryobacteraceae bacterium]